MPYRLVAIRFFECNVPKLTVFRAVRKSRLAIRPDTWTWLRRRN